MYIITSLLALLICSSAITTAFAQSPREVLSTEALNARAWALAPLENAVPSAIRDNLTLLREALLDEGKAAPEERRDSYKTGYDLCNLLIGAVDEHAQAAVAAGYRAAQAEANTRMTNQSLDAHAAYRSSWPQYARIKDQRTEVQRQENNKSALARERVKLDWSDRVKVLQAGLDAAYTRYRQALREDRGYTGISPAAPEAEASGVRSPQHPQLPASTWHPFDISAHCTADIISTADRTSEDQFTFNGGRLASASWLRKYGYPEPGVPEDGRVHIPGTTPSGYFQVRMTPGKCAILLSGPKGHQSKPVTIELAAAERHAYSELAILQSTNHGSGTLRVVLSYETGREASTTIPVLDWSVKGRTGPLSEQVQVAVNLRDTHPRFGAPGEMHALRVRADPAQPLRSITFAFDSFTPPVGLSEATASPRFTIAIFAISGR